MALGGAEPEEAAAAALAVAAEPTSQKRRWEMIGVRELDTAPLPEPAASPALKAPSKAAAAD